MKFNVDCTIRKVAIHASKKCGGLQLFATNETHGKPLAWFVEIKKIYLSLELNGYFSLNFLRCVF